MGSSSNAPTIMTLGNSTNMPSSVPSMGNGNSTTPGTPAPSYVSPPTSDSNLTMAPTLGSSPSQPTVSQSPNTGGTTPAPTIPNNSPTIENNMTNAPVQPLTYPPTSAPTSAANRLSLFSSITVMSVSVFWLH